MVHYLKKTIRKIQKMPHKVLHLLALYRLIKVVQPYTMVDHARLIILYGLAREVLVKKVEGDIVECGVCNGGSAALLAKVIRDDPNYKLLLYDTFEGIPPAGPNDGPLAYKFTGKFKGSIESVREVLMKVQFPLERAVIRQGLFEDTFKSPGTRQVALLHIDADWYDSVLSALRTFYPLMPPGGIIILDDFGSWEGAREAFYDFCKEQNVKPLIEKLGALQVFWRKGYEHNRRIGDTYADGIYWPQPLHIRSPFSLVRLLVWPVRD